MLRMRGRSCGLLGKNVAAGGVPVGRNSFWFGLAVRFRCKTFGTCMRVPVRPHGT